MSDDTARELRKRSDKLFAIQQKFLPYWQEIALNYYPEMADFEGEIPWGSEYGTDLFDSAPVLQRRDLANTVAALLRPRGQTWFKPGDPDERVMDEAGVRDWFEMAGRVQSQWMYRSGSRFVRSTKEADHDFVTFGNAVLSCEPRQERAGLIYQSYHLRDCAWADNDEGEVDTLARNAERTARQLMQRFGDKVHQDIKTACDKDPEKKFKIRHIMMPVDDYEYVDKRKAKRFAKMPFVSVYVDIDHNELLSEAGSFDFRYVVARWQPIRNCPYALSPATTDTLADARQLQVMARTTNEALEKSVDPPAKAAEDAIRGDVNLFAGGLTWYDKDYNEKSGPALELFDVGKNALLALKAIDEARARLASGTYVNKLTQPIDLRDKTAFETQKILEEYVREAQPVTEPWQTNYSIPLLDQTFQQLLRVRAFGPVDEMPDALSSRDFEWQFINPLQETKDKVKVQTFGSLTALAASAEFAPTVRNRVNWDAAYADAARGAGAPEEWLLDEEGANRLTQMQAQISSLQQTIEGLTKAGQAAGTLADGSMKLNEAMGGAAQAVPS